MDKRVNLNELKFIGIVTGIILIFLIMTPVLLMRTWSLTENNESVNNNSQVNYVKGQGVLVKGDNNIKLYNVTTKSIEEMNLEDYITGVVAAEVPAEFNIEALKAQAIAARTYYFSKRINKCSQGNGADICNTTHCQAYITKEERYSKWSKESADEYWSKIEEAVHSTEGMVLVYEGEILKYPQYFAVSSGKTESSMDVFAEEIPYLQSVDSPGEEEVRNRKSTVKVSIDKAVNIINNKYPKAKINKDNIQSAIKIISNTTSGAVKEITIGNITIKGSEFRSLFELKSANFNIDYSNGEMIINCEGYGHGLGMSQYGANAMAKEGSSYEDILKHYYTGVEIEKVKYE